MRHDLTEWTLRLFDGPAPRTLRDELTAPIAATVPGCVHTDLMAAGLIPDPFVGDNEATLAWIGRCGWQYRTVVRLDAVRDDGLRSDLVFEGLDTIADVLVNGEHVAHTENMFRSYRFDVSRLLRPGDNEIVVTFASALDHAERAEQEYGSLPHVNDHPYNAIRKMACNFGWDWGPVLVTAGIWRPARVQRWNGARLAVVRPQVQVELDGDPRRAARGLVRFAVDLHRHGAIGPVSLTATVGGTSRTVTAAADQARADITLEVDRPQLWWPTGYGDQPLYPALLVLTDDQGNELDRWQGDLGFRSVRLDTEPDEAGIPLRLVVNERTVLIRGVNWIPDDTFVTRIDQARYRTRLQQALDAGVNLVRVWGGGIYESEDFYRFADQHGLLIWQDFLFTCAGYTEAEPLRGEILAEAREAVTRLGPHPSLVLWGGGNECIVAYAEWPGWRARIGSRSWGAGYYLDLLPAVLAELDPTRPYLANSPLSIGDFAAPNDPAHGDVHIWDVWNEKDYTDYRTWTPRFVSEFGFAGPAAWSTLAPALRDDPSRADGPDLLRHIKAEDGHGKLARGLAPHLPVPDALRDWVWATQLNQARAIRLGVEHFRSLAPTCTGTVLWQFNDCWPGVSWSVIDSGGQRKPAWYALRAAHADRLLVLRPDSGATAGNLRLIALNDTDRPWSDDVHLTLRSRTGDVLREEKVTFAVPCRETRSFPVPADLIAADGSPDVLCAEATDVERALHFFVEDIVGGLSPAELRTEVTRSDEGYVVRIGAHNFVKDLALIPDVLHPQAVPDIMLITLFPGEDAVVRVRSPVELDPAELVGRPVLRSANDLLAGAGTTAR